MNGIYSASFIRTILKQTEMSDEEQHSNAHLGRTTRGTSLEYGS